jgi:hypothetical protein
MVYRAAYPSMLILLTRHPVIGFPTYFIAQSSMVLVGDGAPAPAKNQATSAIKKIEELTQLSYVVYGFAEVKHRVLNILTAKSIKTCQRRKCSV